MMKITKIILIGLLIIVSSCSKDDSNNDDILSGIYTETTPFLGTHKIDFIDNNTLKVYSRNSTKEKFNYEVSGNIIKLTPTRDLSQNWELQINIINNTKFEITNIFYASIPEDPNPLEFVTFEK